MRLIDADEIMENIDECFDACDQLDVHFTALDVIDIIKCAKIVKAKPIIYAHWIKLDNPLAVIMLFQCSNCKSTVDDTYTFCPYCGATMSENNE